MEFFPILQKNVKETAHYLKALRIVFLALALLFYLASLFPVVTIALFIVSSLFIFFVVAHTVTYIIIRRKFDVKLLTKDLGWFRHAIVVWLIGLPLLGYLGFLRLVGKLKVHVNCAIPEGKWIAAGNHPDTLLRDVFVIPLAIWSRKPKYVANPIAWFPKTVADAQNYGKSWVFRVALGGYFLALVDRSKKDGNGKKKTRILTPIEFVRSVKEFIGAIRVFYVEETRTINALMGDDFEIRRVGQEVLAMGSPKSGAAWLSKLTDMPVVSFWTTIKGGQLQKHLKEFLATRSENPESAQHFFNGPKKLLTFWGLLGLLQLLFQPSVSMDLDIGIPSGPLTPVKEESLEDYTRRIYEAIFEVGKRQLQRSKEYK